MTTHDSIRQLLVTAVDLNPQVILEESFYSRQHPDLSLQFKKFTLKCWVEKPKYTYNCKSFHIRQLKVWINTFDLSHSVSLNINHPLVLYMQQEINMKENKQMQAYKNYNEEKDRKFLEALTKLIRESR